MEKTIIINKKRLIDVLSMAKIFVAKKKVSISILSHCYMRVYGSTCEVITTDLEATFKTYIPCTNDLDIKTKTCIPVDLFLNAVKGLKVPDIVITFEDNHVLINHSYKIITLSSEGFPAYLKMTQVKTVTIPNFAEKLARVSIATGQNDTRYYLNGIYLDFENGIIAGTDGHRMHYEDIPICEDYGKIIIPIDSVKKMIKNKIGDILIFNTEYMMINTKNGIIYSRLLFGNYPKIEDIINNEAPAVLRVVVSKEKLIETLQNATLISKEKTNKVVLAINRNMTISSKNADIGEFNAKIPCKRDDSTYQDFILAFNARYLIEGLQAYPQADTVLDIHGSLSRCFINSNTIVMPLRTI